MVFKQILLFILFVSNYTLIKAQYTTLVDRNFSAGFVKTDLTALTIRNYSVQYEKVVNKQTSISLRIKLIPGFSLPLKNLIINTAGQDDPNIIRTIENLRLSHFAITPELRFYVSKKGYGRGIYFAPFYRYAGFKTNDLTIDYEDGTFTKKRIRLSGKLTTHTGGIMLGAQLYIGKKLCLDGWILGPHYGTGNGGFTGFAKKSLNKVEQDNLRQELNNLDFLHIKKTVTLNNNKASLNLAGAWAGLRAGICVGLRY